MNVVIVYESMYGNTAAVARAIGDGLTAGGATVSVVGVDEATGTHATSCDLLVVGGPTHAHGMTRPGTRETAKHDADNTYAAPTAGDGLRGWLERLPSGGGRLAATFDTRLGAPVVLTGSASKAIAHRLEAHRFTVADHESFIVTKQNELVEGELERATAWGTKLVKSLVAV